MRSAGLPLLSGTIMDSRQFGHCFNLPASGFGKEAGLLRSIQEVLVIYPRQQGQRVPRTATCLSRLEEEEQQRVYEALSLSRYQAA